MAYFYGQSLTFARALNVSESGLAFSNGTRFPAGLELNLQIVADARVLESWITLDSVVRRADGQVVGVEFIRMSDIARPKIQQFLQAASPET